MLPLDLMKALVWALLKGALARLFHRGIVVNRRAVYQLWRTDRLAQQHHVLEFGCLYQREYEQSFESDCSNVSLLRLARAGVWLQDLV